MAKSLLCLESAICQQSKSECSRKINPSGSLMLPSKHPCSQQCVQTQGPKHAPTCTNHIEKCQTPLLEMPTPAPMRVVSRPATPCAGSRAGRPTRQTWLRPPPARGTRSTRAPARCRWRGSLGAHQNRQTPIITDYGSKSRTPSEHPNPH